MWETFQFQMSATPQSLLYIHIVVANANKSLATAHNVIHTNSWAPSHIVVNTTKEISMRKYTRDSAICQFNKIKRASHFVRVHTHKNKSLRAACCFECLNGDFVCFLSLFMRLNKNALCKAAGSLLTFNNLIGLFLFLVCALSKTYPTRYASR